MNLVSIESLNDEVVPYMELNKTEKDGRVIWTRKPKKGLCNSEMKKIKEMNEESAKKLRTEDKRIWFYHKIVIIMQNVGRTFGIFGSESITILVERCHFLRDSFEQFKTSTDLDLRKQIKIYFVDEICQDAGGLIREWFTTLIKELFNPSFGLFIRTKTPEIAYTINPYSSQYHHDHLEYYYFCGQILAKALFEKITIEAYLCKAIYKLLTRDNLSSNDLRYFDTELWNSLEFMKLNKITSFIGNFVISHKNEYNGSFEEIELKTNGKNIPITEENKQEYIELTCAHYLIDSINQQYRKIALGFYSLISQELIQVLNSDELEFFL